MDLADFLVLAGLAFFSYGMSLVSIPAGFVLIGIFLIAIGIWRVFL